MNDAVTPVAFLVAFAIFWIGLARLFAWISGWSALAERFRAGERPDGERVRWASAQLGGVSFKNCLNVTLAERGLHLVPTWGFRLFMPALFLPWSEVRFAGFSGYWIFRFACFRLGPDGTTFAVWPKLGARLAARLDARSRADHAAETKFPGRLTSPTLTKISVAAAVLGLIAAFVASRAGR